MANGELILIIGRHCRLNERYYPSTLALPQQHARPRACPARRSVDPASSTPARSMKPSWEAKRSIPVILSLVGLRVDELSEVRLNRS
jgi:hypothetical protein